VPRQPGQIDLIEKRFFTRAGFDKSSKIQSRAPITELQNSGVSRGNNNLQSGNTNIRP
jgi:hypothetical protein